jgi:hypothetical protein
MPSHEYVAALRWQLHSNGYKPVAVYSRGKRPFGTAWQNRARQNPSGAVTEPVNDAALSTGILCDGLRAIDIDVDDSAIASEVERVAVRIAPVRCCYTGQQAVSHASERLKARWVMWRR